MRAEGLAASVFALKLGRGGIVGTLPMCFRLLLLFGLPLFAGAAPAQVSSIGQFSGDMFEGFESQTVGACVTPDVFGGSAALCSGGGSMNVSSGWNFFCTIQPHGGTEFVGSTSGAATFAFSEPVRRFGGWFGTNGSQGTVSVRLYDDVMGLISSEVANVTADCNWYWNGWESQEPVYVIEIENSVHNGCHVMLDDLQAISFFGLGTNFCTSQINSTGNASSIFGVGSTSIAANDLILRADNVPVGEPGIFYYGPIEASQPFGNGIRCIGLAGPGTIVRLFPFDIAASTGLLSHALDVANPPSIVGQIDPGETWKFQAWFRDPGGGGAGFDLSNGLSVPFTP